MHAIHRALNEFNLENPSEILNMVNNLVVQNISNDSETIIDDGMDIAFCSFDKVTKQLQYSGAHMPVWIVSNADLIEAEAFSNNRPVIERLTTKTTHTIRELKADNQPIGHFMKRIPFTNHTIDLQRGDSLYIFTDGYADQFGGIAGKKFKYKRFKELLLSIQDFPIDQQQAQIKETFRIWKDQYDQVDDVCAFGLQV
jgi:serine phosphatase RsbU (regulator of sigma subunit)